MKNRIFAMVLCLCMVLSMAPATAVATETPIVKDIPIAVNLENAMGIDINIRLDSDIVSSYEIADLIGFQYAHYRSGDTVKIAVASAEPVTYNGTLFILRLTLNREPAEGDELYKLLQVKINEQITFQANDRVILRGITDGKSYQTPVTPGFSEGTATLNGEPYTSGTEISEEGSYVLAVTDGLGKVRTVQFSIDRTPPVITVAPFETLPTDQPVTVTASVNEGTLEADSYTFTENGVYTFVAVDAAGNRSELPVEVSHIYKSFTSQLIGVPEGLLVIQGFQVEPTGWTLQVTYDTGATETVAVTPEMLLAPTDTVGVLTGCVTYKGQEQTFGYEVLSKELAQITVTTPPEKLNYLPGEALDLTGLVVTLTCGENYSVVLEPGSYTVSDIIPDVYDIQLITINYGALSTMFPITVASPVPDHMSSTVYKIENGILSGVALGTTADTLLETIPESAHVRVMDGEVILGPDDTLKTGMAIELFDGDTVKERIVIAVSGDVNGDGTINIADFLLIKSHILGKSVLADHHLIAADFNGDGTVNIADMLLVKSVILSTNA